MHYLWQVWQQEKPGGRGWLERSRGARILEGASPEPAPRAEVARTEVARTEVARAEVARAEVARTEAIPPEQPPAPGHSPAPAQRPATEDSRGTAGD